MSYVGARVDPAAGERRRAHAATVSFAFFLGIVLSVVALGIAASYLGRLLAAWSVAFAIAAATVSLLAGTAALLGPQLRRRVPAPAIHQRAGVGGAFLYGLAYTLATVTTAAGPLLLLLTIAAAIGRPAYGAALSLSYGIGRGLPFFVLGISAGALGAWVSRVERWRRGAEIVSGVALVVIGGYFGWLGYALATS